MQSFTGGFFLFFSVFCASSAQAQNPAALFCMTKGAETVTVTERTGDLLTLCKLGSAQIQAVSLYEYSQRVPRLAVSQFLANIPRAVEPQASTPASFPSSPTPAPAGLYCTQLGGTSEVVSNSLGDPTTLCRFPDLSGIEITTLLAGSLAKSNELLLQALK